MMSNELATEAIIVAGDAIVTVNNRGVITSWNPAAELLLGHTAAQAVGKTLALIVPPEHRARHVGAFHAAMESGQLAHGGRPARVEATTRGGDTVTLAMSLGLLTDIGGGAVGAVAILRPAGIDLVPFVGPSEVPGSAT